MTSYEIHPRTNKIVNASEVYKTNKKTLGGRPELQIIGPLQLAIHVGTKPPRWRAKVALGQDKQKKYII